MVIAGIPREAAKMTLRLLNRRCGPLIWRRGWRDVPVGLSKPSKARTTDVEPGGARAAATGCADRVSWSVRGKCPSVCISLS
jgi:hypothetical protein